MITKTSIQDELPDYYECKKGDVIKIHTYNFGNDDYNRQFSKYGVDTEYTVVYASKGDFTIKLKGSYSQELRHTIFGQRNNSRSMHNHKFNYSFSLVNCTPKNLKDFK